MKKTAALFVALLTALPGCGSMFGGTSQTTIVDSSPQGARCELQRSGEVIGSIEKTPGSFYYKKSKNDANVNCRLEGYNDAQQPLESGIEAWTFGNIIFGYGVFVGWGIDAATGGMNKYPEKVFINMTVAPEEPTEKKDKKSKSREPNS